MTWAREAKNAVEEARASTAALIGAKPEEVFFTSSGTESNNFAVKGLAQANSQKGNHIIVSQVEHFSVLHPVKTLEKSGFKVTQIAPDKQGLIDPADVAKAITKETILVSIMHANNEIGTLQPIEEIGEDNPGKGRPVPYRCRGLRGMGAGGREGAGGRCSVALGPPVLRSQGRGSAVRAQRGADQAADRGRRPGGREARRHRERARPSSAWARPRSSRRRRCRTA